MSFIIALVLDIILLDPTLITYIQCASIPHAGLPPDVMHDVLEGCVQVEICCLLREFILVKKIFSLQTLNTRIANFPRGADAKDHPPRPLTDRFLGDPMAANLKLGGILFCIQVCTASSNVN